MMNALRALIGTLVLSSSLCGSAPAGACGIGDPASACRTDFLAAGAWDQLRQIAPLQAPVVAPISASVPRMPPGGVPTMALSASQDRRVRALGPLDIRVPAAALIPLSAVKDRHWTQGEGFDTPAGRFFINISFDLAGKPFLAAKGPGWRTPLFYPFELGMKGWWDAGGLRYIMSLGFNLFRCRTDNIIRVAEAASGGVVYERRIRDIQNTAFESGLPLRLGAREYRLFHSDSVDTRTAPARSDPARPGLVLIERCSEGVGYKSYVLDMSLLSPAAAGFALENGQTLGLRLSADGVLEIFPL